MAADISNDGGLKKVGRLVQNGQHEEAISLLKNLLIDDPENRGAWEVLAQITQNTKERQYAEYQVRKLAAPTPVQDLRADLGAGDPEYSAKEAYRLFKAGKRRDARMATESILQRSPGNPGALFVFGLLAESNREYKKTLKTLGAVAAEQPDAEPYFERLKRFPFQEDKKRRTPVWLMWSGAGLLLLMVLVALFLPALSGQGPDIDVLEDVAEMDSTSCEELIARAMQVSEQSCQRIGTNEVCYGNNQIESELFGTDPGAFTEVGDVLPILNLEKLRASPLDLVKEIWGVAVFKLMANMPGTVPGQTVTFLGFGNTEIDNDSGDMSAFYFSTGFGGIKCHGVDFDGLRVEVPEGAGIVFQANGVELSLQGDAIMTARPGEQMDVTMVSGTGTVTANGVTVPVGAGSVVSIPMSENLDPNGAPTESTPLTPENSALVCQLYGINCPEGMVSVILDPESAFIGTPVAALTSFPTGTIQGTSTLATATNTPIGWTASPTPTATNTPIGWTASPTPTNSKTPTATPKTPTQTPGGPTATNTPTYTPTRTPTRTPTKTPTNTLVPTNTPTDTPVPTDTEVPAGATCAQIIISSGTAGEFTITNNNSSAVILTELTLSAWPAENLVWHRVTMGGSTIDAVQYPSPPATRVFGNNPAKRTISAGGSKILTNDFTGPAAATGYSAQFTFDIGCVKSASN